MIRYNSEIEQKMRFHFGQLMEKGRRHYAAVEASKLSYGGIRYISQSIQDKLAEKNKTSHIN